MNLKSYFIVDIPIDADVIKFRIRRLNFEEGSAVRAKFRDVYLRKPKAEDDAADPRPDLEAEDAFMVETVRNYATFESEVILEAEDGTEKRLKTGDDILDVFGARWEIIREIHQKVMVQNAMTADQKKVSKSRTGSLPSSNEPEKEVAGQKPGTTADSAASAGSASNGDATRPTTDPSGSTTDPKTSSSSTNAPSLH